MIALNANPKTVMQRMGHSSIQVTYDRYGHLFDGHDEELTAALGEVHRRSAAGYRPELLVPVLS